MTRTTRLLLLLILAELIGGAVYLLRRPRPLVPPVPELTETDPLLASQIHDRAAKCQTPEDWATLGELYLAYGYFPEAEACYRVAAERAPNNPDRVYEWGFALERIGRLAEANDAYRRAAELGHSDPGGCWYYVGRNHLRTETTEDARAAFEKAGDHPAARYEIARLLVRDGRAMDAVPSLDRLAAEYPKAVEPPLLRHKIEILGAGPAAAAFADRSRRAPDRLPTPFRRDWDRLEAVHEKHGRPGEMHELQRMLEAGNWTAAEPRIRELLRVEWDPSAVDLLAEFELLRSRPAEAAKLFREVIDRAGPSTHFLFRLGDALAEAGQPEQAAEAWEWATRLGPLIETKDPHHRLGTHFEKTGKKDAARFHLARAYLGAGHQEFATGQYRDARTPLKLAAEYDPKLAEVWFYLGEAHRLIGDAPGAREAYGKCLALDADFGRAIVGLKLLP